MVGAVDVDDGGAPCLPVDVGVFGHNALADGIAHVKSVAVVAGIAEHDRLEVRHSRPLVREELVVEFLGAEALVGIDGHRLAGSVSRPSSRDAGFTELVQPRGLVGSIEELDVHA